MTSWKMTRRMDGMVLIGLGLILASLVGCSAGGWGGKVAMFNGEDLAGWRYQHPERGGWVVAKGVTLNPQDDTQFKLVAGTGVMVNNAKGKVSNIFSSQMFGDCKAHVEFMVPKGSNSGVYFQGRYEVQVLDSYGKTELLFSDCGGIYARWDGTKTIGGTPPRVNASKAPGQWQSYDVIFRAPRFAASGKKIENARFVKVVHNGIVVHENIELEGPTRASMFEDEVPLGPLMLQGDHGPVAYRNVWVKPL